jgi:hypothetical protein
VRCGHPELPRSAASNQRRFQVANTITQQMAITTQPGQSRRGSGSIMLSATQSTLATAITHTHFERMSQEAVVDVHPDMPQTACAAAIRSRR